MPRYSISNAPTEMKKYPPDPADFGVDWGIYMTNRSLIIIYVCTARPSQPLPYIPGSLVLSRSPF